ncbi:LysR family transcriptional regulator [Colwellia psychrerythraea]|uniref:Transcriptional regulator, LysR family n=1 Tax=Colwellia psychrerythraea TaxID=28229 RepID=A0A099KMJ3_COLPS|nr:LysR family transcriptional regulator [Colwellia psychrerythraea]KGJ91676.1 transcriptional regulator, LysR family [Colwellia psychrerythraea]
MNLEINITDIRAFVLIVKAGSFTAAAEQLLCSRSHLSKQLSQLESALGVKLITRTTRSQRLTEQGKLFFEQCSCSFDGVERAIEQAIDDASEVKGLININCVGGYIGEDIIAPLVNDFIQQCPDVRVNLDFSSGRVDLIAGEFDIVFRMGQLEDSNLIAQKLLDISIGTLASPRYLKDNGQLSHPKDLKQHQCITGSLNSWTFSSVITPITKIDVTVNGQFKCKNGRAMINSAVAGNGIVRLPYLYCHKEITNGALVPIFTDWAVPESPFYMVYVQDKYQPARLRAFIDFVRNNIAQYSQVS